MDQTQIKGIYFKEQLEQGIRRIYEKQREVAGQKIGTLGGVSGGAQSRGAALMQSLQSPSYSVTARGDAATALMEYPISIRFMDMKHLGNWKIYNRVIWGILYRETLQDIRYEFSDWLRKHMGNQLRTALGQPAP